MSFRLKVRHMTTKQLHYTDPNSSQ